MIHQSIDFPVSSRMDDKCNLLSNSTTATFKIHNGGGSDSKLRVSSQKCCFISNIWPKKFTFDPYYVNYRPVCKLQILQFWISITTSAFDLKFSPVIGIDNIRLCAKFQFDHLSGWYFTDQSVNPFVSLLGCHYRWSSSPIDLKFSPVATIIKWSRLAKYHVRHMTSVYFTNQAF